MRSVWHQEGWYIPRYIVQVQQCHDGNNNWYDAVIRVGVLVVPFFFLCLVFFLPVKTGETAVFSNKIK